MKYLFSIILAFAVTLGRGTERDVKLSKTEQHSFTVEPNVKLEVTNKYGDVVVQTWEHDSVYMEITIHSYGKDEKTAQKQMDRVDFEFSQVGKFLIAETVFDKSKGFLRDLWNEISDYSKTIISKSKLTVEYQLRVPSYTQVQVNNKFGDIFIGDVSGKISIELSNGNMKAGKLAKGSELDLSFGRASFKMIRDSYVKLRSVDFEVDKAVLFNVKSSSSSVIISEADAVKIDSRSDKYKIGEVEKINGTGNFTKLDIESLAKSLNMDMKYGALNLQEVAWDFEDIDVKSNSTDITLKLSEDSYIETEIIAKENKLSIPENNLKNVIKSDKDKYAILEGNLGKKIGNKASKMRLDTEDGEVIIRFSKSVKVSTSN